MRKTLLVSSLFIAALLGAILLPARLAVVVGGAAGGGAAIGNGGFNGDLNRESHRDVSDAIYLFRYVFQGGPEPLACAQVQEPPGRCCDPQPEDLVYFGFREYSPQEFETICGRRPRND